MLVRTCQPLHSTVRTCAYTDVCMQVWRLGAIHLVLETESLSGVELAKWAS